MSDPQTTEQSPAAEMACSPKLRCKLCHIGVSDEEAAANVEDLRWKCSRSTNESLGKIKHLAEHPSDLAVINHELIRRMTRRSIGVDPIYFLEGNAPAVAPPTLDSALPKDVPGG